MTRITPVCKACDLPERESAELDLILSMPPDELDSRLFDVDLPPPDLPAAWQQFGAIRKAQFWLVERGYKIERRTLVRHTREHVTAHLVSDGTRAIARGTLSDGSPVPTVPEPLKLAIEYHAFFRLGMETGHRALEILAERIADPTQKPSNTLLLAVAQIGRQLAQAQAAIVTRGVRFVLEDDDAISGFIGEDERPSPRFGSYRVRTIEGERRPVRDEGPADRRDHNARAREEGSTELPAP